MDKVLLCCDWTQQFVYGLSSAAVQRERRVDNESVVVVMDLVPDSHHFSLIIDGSVYTPVEWFPCKGEGANGC